MASGRAELKLYRLPLARWCATQPDLVRFRGECLLYRAEVLQLRGNWSDAARDAQDACALLMSRPAAGAASPSRGCRCFV
jgi:hypothetical protein